MKETKKKLEVLITTMNCSNFETLLSQMNIQTSTMIGNQCATNSVEIINYKGFQSKVYNFNEKGVGLNRNNLLMRTQSDFCLFGDDDLKYVQNYEAIVLEEFEKRPDADVLIFNLKEKVPARFIIKDEFKVHFRSFMRFGAARIAIRTKCIVTHGILFNICFGGGTIHSNGEDTLFLSACLKAGLHIYAINKTIAELNDDRESTWFHGYNEKYFLDKGLLYYMIHRKWYKILILQDAIRHKNLYKQNVTYLYKTMKRGVEIERKNRFE